MTVDLLDFFCQKTNNIIQYVYNLFIFVFYKAPTIEEMFKLLLLVTLVHSAVSGQHLTHEVGLHAGSAIIQGDYQINYDLNSITRVSGMSVSLTHTMHFLTRTFVGMRITFCGIT